VGMDEEIVAVIGGSPSCVGYGCNER
jgi:hypothetical protein